MNTVGVSSRATTKVLTGTGTSALPIRIRSQEIVSPRGTIGPHKFRNAYPFKTSINQFSPKHGHLMPILVRLWVRKTVANESAEVYARKRMYFGSNSVAYKSPNLMDFGLSTAKTPDKVKSIIFPTTRVGSLMNGSNWLPPRHDIEKVTVELVSEVKAYSKCRKKTSLKL